MHILYFIAVVKLDKLRRGTGVGWDVLLPCGAYKFYVGRVNIW
jgi:hypothetical protein